MDDGTYDQRREPVSYLSGYQVGLWTRTTDAEDIEAVIDEILSKRMAVNVEASLEANADVWGGQGSIGLWAGEWGIWTSSDGFVFVEPCVWFSDLEDALNFGRRYQQQSVWCWATMKEILIDP